MRPDAAQIKEWAKILREVQADRGTDQGLPTGRPKIRNLGVAHSFQSALDLFYSM
jgi:hypothetical protein